MTTIPARIAAGLLAAALSSAMAQPVLKSQLGERQRSPRPDLAERSLHPERLHWRLDFPQHPTIDDYADLRRRGATVSAALPATALLVAGTREQVEGSDGAIVSRLSPLDKISPELDPPANAETMALSPEGGRTVLVEFHRDVPVADALEVLHEEGVRVLDHPQLRNDHYLLEASDEQIARLARWDEVAYLFPGDTSLVRGEPVHACLGALTSDGSPVSQAIQLVGQGWAPGRVPTTLNFAYGQLSTKLDNNRVRNEIVRALNEWSRVVQIGWSLTTNLSGPRTLAFRFGRGPNGGPEPFDGPGKKLAYAYFPAPPNPEPIAGDLYFDDDEDWRFGANTDVYSVVLHEIGHALGLGHGDVPGTVMYPYYRMAANLTETDINAIRLLYAARNPAGVTPPGATPPGATPPGTPPPTAPPATPPATPPPTNPPANPPSSDRTAPTLLVTSPLQTTVNTSAASITFAGTATDNVGVTSVTWETSLNRRGTASGTTAWSAAIPLEIGINVVIVRAFDAAGNQSWRTAVVIRR